MEKTQNHTKIKKLTQEQLAEMIGLNQRQLTCIETGRSYPSFHTLDKLCEVLNINPALLFDFSDCQTNINTSNIIGYDEIIEKIQLYKDNESKIKFFKY